MQSILSLLERSGNGKITDKIPSDSQVKVDSVAMPKDICNELNLVFCIHGRGVKSDTLNFYEKELKKLIGSSGVVFNTKCREVDNITLGRSISDQVLLLRNEIEKCFLLEVMENENNRKKKFKLLIVGHSQGGVLAVELSKALDTRFRKNYNISKVVIAVVTAPIKGINGNTEVLGELASLLSLLVRRVKDSLKVTLNDILPFTDFNNAVVDALKIEDMLIQSLNDEQLPSKSTYPGCVGLSVKARSKCGFFSHKDPTIYIKAKCSIVKFIQDVGLDFTIRANPLFGVAVAWFGQSVVTNAVGDAFSMLSSADFVRIEKLHRRLIDDQDNDGMVPFASQAPGCEDEVCADSVVASFDYDVSHQSVLIDASVPQKIYNFFLEKCK